jgi:nitric oxide reductase NorE protein
MAAISRPDPPGDTGVWFFIFADMCAFAVFFLVFMAGRAAQPDLYETARRALDLRLGLANTLILLTSGAFMAQATRRARHHDWPAARRAIVVAQVTGAPFAATKALEWWTKIHHGIGLTTSEFFTFYFIFTGVHFLHFVIGMVVLTVLAGRACNPAIAPATRQRWIEAGGAYWHMVDLLWIVLFAMLYLMRAR